VFDKYDLVIMSLELITIVPHGTILIKELKYGLENNTLKTIQGLNVIRHLIKDKRLDHLFVLDPHSKILSSKISIVTSPLIVSSFRKEDVFVSKQYSNDKVSRDLASYCSFDDGVSSIDDLRFDSSWGSLVPLWFLQDKESVGVITIDSQIERSKIIDFGKNFYNFINLQNKRIGIVLSCDFSHTHSKNNPMFPYSECSKEFDDLLVEMFENNDLKSFRNIDDKFIYKARTDVKAQLLVLCGILEMNSKLKSYFLSYEVPTYFGMITGYLV